MTWIYTDIMKEKGMTALWWVSQMSFYVIHYFQTCECKDAKADLETCISFCILTFPSYCSHVTDLATTDKLQSIQGDVWYAAWQTQWICTHLSVTESCRTTTSSWPCADAVESGQLCELQLRVKALHPLPGLWKPSNFLPPSPGMPQLIINKLSSEHPLR